MRPQHFVILLILLTLAVPASPAHAGGIVSSCNQQRLQTALAGGGTVTFSCSGTITLTATITIAADTTIDGSGQTVTISGNHAVRVFAVNPGVTLNLNRLTVANGRCVLPFGSSDGGGIYNRGTLNVSNSTFFGNYADRAGGGIYNLAGAVTVNNSTFSGNRTGEPTDNGRGGGISNLVGAVTVNNSTFAGNSAWLGGGIYNQAGYNPPFGGTLTVSNSTFAGNGAKRAGGGIYNSEGAVSVSNSTFFENSANYGGGINNEDIYVGKVTLKNTIVANSPTGRNCYNNITDGGGNLSYPDATCPGINRDPVLGPLQENGGPTWTMALLPGSAARDAANDAICAAPPVNNLDQRGVVRPQGAHCDIGAYEAKPPPIFLPFIMR